MLLLRYFTMDNDNDDDNPSPLKKIQNHISQEAAATFKLAPFNPSCEQAQLVALNMLELDSEDVLFDLGCGDARLLIQAVQNIQGLRSLYIQCMYTVCQAKRFNLRP